MIENLKAVNFMSKNKRFLEKAEILVISLQKCHNEVIFTFEELFR